MAEEELQEETYEDESELDEEKPGKAKLFIALGLSAVLGIGGGKFVVPALIGGGDSVAEASESSDGGHGSESLGAVGSLHSISNLVVNARGSDGNRLLVATVAIEVTDNAELEELRERDIQLRDEITSILESIPMGILVRLGARDTVKQRVSEMLERYVHGEHRVYVPQFVLQ